MSSRHKTARGREFNMQAFAEDRGDVTAVGNTARNARGDLLGKGGKVIATAQQVTNHVYNNAGPSASKTVKLDPLEQEISRKEVIGADGIPRWEVAYADGSVEVIAGDKPAQNLDFDFRNTSKEL